MHYTAYNYVYYIFNLWLIHPNVSSPCYLITKNLFSVSMNLAILDSSHQWVICHLWLTFFTQHMSFWFIYIIVYARISSFQCWIIFYFLYPVILKAIYTAFSCCKLCCIKCGVQFLLEILTSVPLNIFSIILE